METGRPPKYTPERLAHILDNIGAGVSYRLSAKFAGIAESTLYEWIESGKKYKEENVDHPLVFFSESIKIVENAKLRQIIAKLEGADKNWQSSAWLLERRWWQDYSSATALIEMNRAMDTFMENKDGKEAKEMDSKISKS